MQSRIYHSLFSILSYHSQFNESLNLVIKPNNLECVALLCCTTTEVILYIKQTWISSVQVTSTIFTYIQCSAISSLGHADIPFYSNWPFYTTWMGHGWSYQCFPVWTSHDITSTICICSVILKGKKVARLNSWASATWNKKKTEIPKERNILKEFWSKVLQTYDWMHRSHFVQRTLLSRLRIILKSS